MTRMARCWIIGLLAACGLPQAQAADVTLGTIHTESPARNAVWLSDGCPTAEIVRCSGAGDACESVADGCCDPCCRGGGLFGGGGLLGREVGDETPLSVWVWAGPTYASSAMSSLLGFGEGVYGGYRINENVGAFVGAGFNHNSDSTQFLGTVGIQKFGNEEGDGVLERTSIWVFWDQAADFEYPDIDISQLRFQIGYMLGDKSEAGVTFTTPISDDNGGNVLSPLGGPTFMAAGTDYIGAYMRRRVRETDLTAQVGAADASSSLAFGLGAKRRIRERTNLVVEAKYGGEASWAGMVGVEYGLGRADTVWHHE